MLYMSKNEISKSYILGVDIGGSHITVALIDLSLRTIVGEFVLRRKVDPHASAEMILQKWCDTIRECWQKFNLVNTRVGFAMPGPFDYAGGVCLIKGFEKYELLYGINIRAELAQRLNIPGSDIAFRNDAEAFLEGEIFCGAAQGYNHVIGLTLGTGMGSAYSHFGITADAELSVTRYAGRIIEEFVSTRGLVGFYRGKTGLQIKDAESLAKLCHEDAGAVKSFKDFAIPLSWILNLFIVKEHPEIVVIGGNISNSWNLFMDDVIERLTSSLPEMPKITKTMMGENAALIGAACCFRDAQREFFSGTPSIK